MKTLALIAHDGKKAEMVGFVKDHLASIRKFQLVATGTTGMFIEKAGLKVRKVESGPKGGDAQIAAMIADGVLDGIIFFTGSPWYPSSRARYFWPAKIGRRP